MFIYNNMGLGMA